MEINQKIEELERCIYGLRRKSISGRGLNDSECVKYRRLMNELIVYRKLLENELENSSVESNIKLVNVM